MVQQAGAARSSTLREVAQRAGVSHQTVSRFLRGEGPFRPETEARVEAAIRELNYRPNMLARSMRTQRTGVLTVVLPSQIAAMPMPTLVSAAEAAVEMGFYMEISVVQGGAEARAERAVELMESGRVDGVLSLGHLPGLSDAPKMSGSAALVVLDQFDDKLRGKGPLADASVVREIVEALAALGHRNFLHIAGPAEWSSAQARRRTYENAVADLGLHSYGVLGGGWAAEVGFDVVSGLPEDCGVTAIVAANDYVGLGAMRAAHERGWSVPGDVSVVGWDNIDAGRYCIPKLSTVWIDSKGQGRSAMRRLISLVNGQAPESVTVEPSRLVLRESTGPV